MDVDAEILPKNSCPKSTRVLVHVHLFYCEMWNSLRSCLENLDKLNQTWDLYVTLVDTLPKNVAEGIIGEIKLFKAKAKILTVAYKGYDVGPFFEVLNYVNLDDYDLVVKLHSKRNVNPLTTLGTFYDVSGPKWREYLLAFINSRKVLKKTLRSFSSDPLLGMTASYNLIMPFREHGKYNIWVIEECRKLFKQLNITPTPAHNFHYVAGTMFAVRTDVVKKLKELNLDINSFNTPDRSTEKDLAHVLEYFMGWLVTSLSITEEANSQVTAREKKLYKIKDVFTGTLSRYFDVCSFISKHHRLVKILRFILRREYEPKQNTVYIKIFKVSIISYKI